MNKTKNTILPVIIKICKACKTPFGVTHRGKQYCPQCHPKHNKTQAQDFTMYSKKRQHHPLETKIRIKYKNCQVCNYSKVVDLHHEGQKLYILCPNCHALITRKINTIKDFNIKELTTLPTYRTTNYIHLNKYSPILKHSNNYIRKPYKK